MNYFFRCFIRRTQFHLCLYAESFRQFVDGSKRDASTILNFRYLGLGHTYLVAQLLLGEAKFLSSLEEKSAYFIKSLRHGQSCFAVQS